LRLDLQVLDPAVVVEAAIGTVRLAAQAKSIEIRRSIEPNAGPVTGDPARLQQVVWNLLSNAIKFTERGGRVDLLVRRSGSSAEIVVSDNGRGIPPDFLPVVFERFRQFDASLSRAQGGLGLGLAIVKNLVELHGGTVSARSAGEGKGATFVVTLPLSAGVEAGSDRESQEVDPLEEVAFHTVDLSGIRVVAVDDDADTRELIRRVLTGCAAEVLTANSAQEALRLVDAERPDLVISDIGMPEVDGFELLRRLNRLDALRGTKIPVIALTAFARGEDRARALAAGFRAHLTKPIEPAELVANVASLSGRGRAGLGSPRPG
jgi:CheY-like chemotaxis protein/anti-sigma regulatory factor (Ser/Thr protein kinase)